jgi:predicted metal-dependent hydrolase
VSISQSFAVKSLRRVLPKIRDEALREALDRFCRQEARWRASYLYTSSRSDSRFTTA